MNPSRWVHVDGVVGVRSGANIHTTIITALAASKTLTQAVHPHLKPPMKQPTQTERKPPLGKPQVNEATLTIKAPTNNAGKCGASGLKITANDTAGKLIQLL